MYSFHLISLQAYLRDLPAYVHVHTCIFAYLHAYILHTHTHTHPYLDKSTEREREREREREGGECVNGNTGLANTQEAFPFLSETSKPRWE